MMWDVGNAPVIVGLSLFGAGLVLFIIGMCKRHKGLRRWSYGVAALGILGLLCPRPEGEKIEPVSEKSEPADGIREVGGYIVAEYRVTFKDKTGTAVEGVELRVEDYAGHVYYYYPVADFLPGQVPRSDRDGVMTFHHFSGIFFPSERSSMWPHYLCRFFVQGKEVYRTDYGRLDLLHVPWEKAEKVIRRWKPPTWPTSELARKPGESLKEAEARWKNFFDLNRNGRLEPEEACARRAAQQQEFILEQLRIDNQTEAEVEFPVIRETVVIDAPHSAPGAAGTVPVASFRSG